MGKIWCSGERGRAEKRGHPLSVSHCTALCSTALQQHRRAQTGLSSTGTIGVGNRLSLSCSYLENSSASMVALMMITRRPGSDVVTAAARSSRSRTTMSRKSVSRSLSCTSSMTMWVTPRTPSGFYGQKQAIREEGSGNSEVEGKPVKLALQTGVATGG